MKFLSKKQIAVLLVFILFLGLFLVNTNEAKANILGEIGKDVLQAVFYVLFKIAHAFTTLVTKIFTAILNFGFQKMDMVYLGWTITRDIVNMFFILGLIVIAFATILRIETYGMKALLPKLIIIALLINFSYLACGIIIDASQILTSYFLGQIQTNDIGLAMLDTLKVQTAIMPEQGTTVPITTSDPGGALILNLAFSAAIIFVAGFVLLIGAILLFLRIGALWALIILAPFAWFFGIFPALKSHNDKWWSEFFKWSFFAPIYVFFIYLVLKIARETSALSLGQDTQTGLTMTEMTSNLNLFFYFVFLVILLCGAPTLAMSLGIKSAGTVTAFAKGALKGTVVKGTGAALRGGWRRFERQVLAPAGVSPRAFKEAWKLRREEKEKKAYAPAVGKWRDQLNQVLDHTKTFEQNRAKDMLIDEERGILRKQNLSKPELTEFLNQAYKNKDYARSQAALLELVDRGDDEGLSEHAELGAKFGNVASIQTMQNLIKGITRDEKEAIKLAGTIEATGKARGLPYYDGMTQYDPATQQAEWIAPSKLGERGGIEAMKIHPQARWRTLNRRTYLTQDVGGNPVAVTNTLKTMLRHLDAQDADRAEKEMPGYNKDYIKKGKITIQAEINTIADPGQKARTQDWLDKIVASAPSP